MSDSSTKTNLTTTHVSQIGSRVSTPVMKSRRRLGRGAGLRMARLCVAEPSALHSPRLTTSVVNELDGDVVVAACAFDRPRLRPAPTRAGDRTVAQPRGEVRGRRFATARHPLRCWWAGAPCCRCGSPNACRPRRLRRRRRPPVAFRTVRIPASRQSRGLTMRSSDMRSRHSEDVAAGGGDEARVLGASSTCASTVAKSSRSYRRRSRLPGHPRWRR